MSWSDEELDQLYRDVIKNKAYPGYQEHFFDEVETFLPKNPTSQRRKRYWFWYTTPALLIFLFIPWRTTEYELKAGTYTVAQMRNQYIGEVKELNRLNQPSDQSSISSKNYWAPGQKNNPGYQIGQTEANESGQAPDFYENVNEEGHTDEINSKINSWDRLAYRSGVLIAGRESTIQPLGIRVKKRINEFSVGTNIGMMESFVKISGSKPSLAIDVNTSYRKKYGTISAAIGLNLSMVFPQKMQLSKESRVYGIRIDNYEQHLNFKSVFVLEVPLIVSKHVNKHSFYLGAAPQFNLGSCFDLEKKTNHSDVVREKYIGNRYAMSNFGLKTMVGYNFQLPGHFEAGIQLANYWNSPFRSNELSVELNKAPVVGQITIKKYFQLR